MTINTQKNSINAVPPASNCMQYVSYTRETKQEKQKNERNKTTGTKHEQLTEDDDGDTKPWNLTPQPNYSQQ